MSTAASPAASVKPVRGATATLVLLFVLYVLNYMDRNVMGAVADQMKADLSLSDTELGLLQTLFLVCVAIFALPASFLVDRWSRRKAIVAMAVVWSAATAGTGLAAGFTLLLVARTVVGVGEAGYSPAGTAILSTAYPPDRRAKVLGLFFMAMPIGAALGTVLGGVLAGRSGSWTTPFLVFGAAGVLVGLAVLLLPDYPAPRTAQPVAFGSAIATLVRIPTLRWTYLAFGMNAFISSATLAWLAPYLGRVHGLDVAAAAKKAGLVFALALVGSPLGGYLGDRWARSHPSGRYFSCVTTSALSAVFLFAGIALGASPLGFGCLLLSGLFIVAYLPPAGAATQDVTPPGLAATAWGIAVLSGFLLGGAYSPVVVGKISDVLGSLSVALMVVPVAGILAAALFALAARTYEADRTRAAALRAAIPSSSAPPA
ncbi:MAG: MFS transporter [Deltaproteobacteria bacterium]|nr:MFS transporter [Deltaproteobacteria bacterium]